MRRYLCGCPAASCTGGGIQINAALRSATKAHTDRSQAFKCFSRYLLSTGHTRLSSREYETPRGTILILDRMSQFGGELRRGKNEKGQGKRFVPYGVHGGLVV